MIVIWKGMKSPSCVVGWARYISFTTRNTQSFGLEDKNCDSHNHIHARLHGIFLMDLKQMSIWAGRSSTHTSKLRPLRATKSQILSWHRMCCESPTKRGELKHDKPLQYQICDIFTQLNLIEILVKSAIVTCF